MTVDMFPLTAEERYQVLAIRAQQQFGDWSETLASGYTSLVAKSLPHHMREDIESERVSQQHASKSHCTPLVYLFFQMAQNLDLRCVFLPAPIGAADRNQKHVSNPDYVIKTFKPRFMHDCFARPS